MACIRTSFICYDQIIFCCMAKLYSILCIHLSVDGHLGYLHHLIIKKNPAINICMLCCVWKSVSFLLGYIPRNRTARPYGHSV